MNTSFHALRHAHASILIKGGTHMKVISQRLGHSSIDITMDTYGHLLPGVATE
jgi:integrase